MTSGQYGHQNWLVTMQTPIPVSVPAFNFNGVSFLQGYQSKILSALQQGVTTSQFVANGSSSVKNASISNLTFPVHTNGNVAIQFNTDTYTDITWLEAAEIIGVVVGVSVTIAGLLTADPVLVIIGVIITVAALTVAAYEVFREALNCLGGDFLKCLGSGVSQVSLALLILGGAALIILLRPRNRGGGGGVTIIRRRNGSS